MTINDNDQIDHNQVLHTAAKRSPKFVEFIIRIIEKL